MKKLIILLSILSIFSCSKGEENSNCFSPTQNLENAYDENSMGCDCDSNIDKDTCVKDQNGRYVALVCSEGKWISVVDGPCFLPPPNNEVNIRLFNYSNQKFENATFNGVNFGNINPGEKTEYKKFENSYSYGTVLITINGVDYGWQPIDFVGENLLKKGKYTFKYKFDNELKKLTDYLISESNKETNSTCFSPTQNLENAYDENSVGCNCDSNIDKETCVKDQNGRYVALICSEKKWTAVQDGACFPKKE